MQPQPRPRRQATGQGTADPTGYFGSGVVLPVMPLLDMLLPVPEVPLLPIESFDMESFDIAPLFMLFFDMPLEDLPVLVVPFPVPSADPLLVAEPPLRPPPPPPPEPPPPPLPPAPPAPWARADTEPRAMHEARNTVVSFFIFIYPVLSWLRDSSNG